MQNGKVGEGDVFLRKNVFIALFASKLPNSSSIITAINAKFRMKVLQHVLVYKRCFQLYR
jgi:hypothetical protein